MKTVIEQIKEIDGVKIVTTVNKDMVLVEFKNDNSETLLERAKRLYPVGTKFIYDGKIRNVSKANHVQYPDDENIYCGGTLHEEWVDFSNCSNPPIFEDGKWAEIVPIEKSDFKIKYITEGADIFLLLKDLEEKMGKLPKNKPVFTTEDG